MPCRYIPVAKSQSPPIKHNATSLANEEAGRAVHNISDCGRAHLHGDGMFDCDLVDDKRLAAAEHGGDVGQTISMGWSQLRSYK